MNVGVFEYHQWPLVTTFGKIQAVAGQFLIGHAGQHRDRKRDLRKGIEQFAVLDQRHAAVEQVAPLIRRPLRRRPGSRRSSGRTAAELVAKLGQRPEDEIAAGSRRRSSIGRRLPISHTDRRGGRPHALRTQRRRKIGTAAKSRRPERRGSTKCSNSRADRLACKRRDVANRNPDCLSSRSRTAGLAR